MSETIRNSSKVKEHRQSERFKSQLHNAHKKHMVAVDQYDKDMSYINTFESISEASRQLKIRKSDIQAVIGNRQKTAKGYIFRRHSK